MDIEEKKEEKEHTIAGVGRTLHGADEYSVRIYSTWVLKSKREGQKEK